MTPAYFARLAGLSMAASLAVQFAAGWLVKLFTPWLLRRAGEMSARRAERWIFAARILPTALAVLAVGGLCVPSYLWLEPQTSGETLSPAAWAAALVGAALWTGSLWRAGRALWLTHRSVPRRAGLVVIPSDQPMLGLAGLLRTRVVISTAVLGALCRLELEAALRHEEAHRRSGDNWKRLAFLATPRVPGSSALETAWFERSEWAADDEAAPTEFEALDLASALVRVARLGEAARPALLVTPLVNGPEALEWRVERLLRPREAAFESAPAIGWMLPSSLVALGAITLWHGALLSAVYELLELLAGA